MRLVRARKHPSGERCGGGNDGVVPSHIELLDEERAPEKERTIVLLDPWQAIGDGRMEDRPSKELLLDVGRQEIEKRVDAGPLEQAAELGEHALATAERWAPVVHNRNGPSGCGRPLHVAQRRLHDGLACHAGWSSCFALKLDCHSPNLRSCAQSPLRRRHSCGGRLLARSGTYLRVCGFLGMEGLSDPPW